jgi:hypothetical protein
MTRASVRSGCGHDGQIGPEACELTADREAVVVAARLEESPRSLPEARLVIDDHDLWTATAAS